MADKPHIYMPVDIKTLKPLPEEYKIKPKEEPVQWFAMRAIYRYEIFIKEKLEADNFKCFVPLEIKERVIHGRKTRTWAPVINNLIFVQAKKSELHKWKQTEPRLQYLMKRAEGGRYTQIVIPDDQMTSFIRIYENGNHEVRAMETDFKPGMAVRVISGPFQGMTGRFQKVKGHRERRFVITLDNVAFISTTDVGIGMIEKI